MTDTPPSPREPSAGQKADDKAFADWWLTLIGFGAYPNKRLARAAYDAGMKRGEEKRGCCEEPND